MTIKINKIQKCFSIVALISVFLTCTAATCAALNLQFDPSSLIFPSTLVGNTSHLRLGIKNNGTSRLTVYAVDTSDGVFKVEGLQQGVVIDVNATIDALVSFSPGEDKAYAGIMRIIFKGTSSVASISLQGSGYKRPEPVTPPPLPPNVHCNPLSVDFGSINVGDVKYAIVNCRNAGEEDAVLQIVGGLDTNDFSIAGHSSLHEGVTLGGGEDKNLVLKFEPKSIGQFSDSLTLLWDYTAEQTQISVTGQSASSSSPKYSFYKYTDIPGQSYVYPGQGQIFIVDLQGEDLVLDDPIINSQGLQFEEILSVPAVKSMFGQQDRKAHYLYALILDQRIDVNHAYSQLALMNFDHESIFNAACSVLKTAMWPEWNAIPKIKLTLNAGEKVIYLENNILNHSLYMNLDFSWKRSPADVEEADFYIILVNQNSSRIYCYDMDFNKFKMCRTIAPSVKDIQPGFGFDDILLPFEMPVDEDGIWRVYIGMVAEDGAVFYDQAAIVVRQAVGGELVNVYE